MKAVFMRSKETLSSMHDLAWKKTLGRPVCTWPPVGVYLNDLRIIRFGLQRKRLRKQVLTISMFYAYPTSNSIEFSRKDPTQRAYLRTPSSIFSISQVSAIDSPASATDYAAEARTPLHQGRMDLRRRGWGGAVILPSLPRPLRRDMRRLR